MQARYRILALITDTTAMALSLDSQGNTKPVSINGNPCMYYETAEDMKTFVQYIKDYYSINDFDDDDFALMIVNCGSDAAVAEHLHELTLKAGNNSLIRAEYALPFIAANKRKIKKNDDFTVSVLEAMYTICIDENGKVDCTRCAITDTEATDEESENALTLEPADFAVLFAIGIGVFGDDEEALKQKDEQTVQLHAEYEQKLAFLRLINSFKKVQLHAEYKQKLADMKTEYERQLTELQTKATIEEKPNLPAVVNDTVGKMVLIEAGSFDSFYKNIFGANEIESFYISATPVTMREYFDVTGIIPKAILGLYILKKNFMGIEDIPDAEIKNISTDDLEDLYLDFMEEFYVDNPIIDEEHRVLLQDNKQLIMPKSVLDSVDVDLCKKYSFLAQEDFMQQAILSYGLDVPITYISLYDAARFCNAKSKMEGLRQAYTIKSTDRIEYDCASTGYYIPNYTEWLYAACGGKDRPEDFQYGGCGTLTEVAWYEKNSGGVLHPVAQKKPNTLGLYDMLGNVREWIVSMSDMEGNGNTLIYNTAEVIGGSAYDSREACTLHAISEHELYSLSYKYGDIGFRICKPYRADGQ